MPTTRPRHIVTETDDIAAAIDRAESNYPGATRAQILRQLVLLGAQSADGKSASRRELVRQLAGGFEAAFPDGYLDDLRAEWPE